MDKAAVAAATEVDEMGAAGPSGGGAPHLAILGSGPIGLEAALAAVDAGLPFTLYEAGAEPASHVADWGHVRLFTPWDLDVSPRQRRHLAAAGHQVPAGAACPSGGELRERALAPIAGLPAVAPHLRLGTRVRAVGRQGLVKHEEIANAARAAQPFRLLVETAGGEQRIEHADIVLDCTGTWSNPNTLGDGGIPAPGEEGCAGRIVRRIPDLSRERGAWAGKTVLVAGAGHSAQTAVLELAALAEAAPGTRVLWLLRRDEPGFAAISDDPLPDRAALATAAVRLAAGASPAVTALPGAVVEAVAEGPDGSLRVLLRQHGEHREIAVDRVLSLTGAVGDHTLYRQLQVHECYATCGPMKLSAALLGAAGGDCLEQTSHGVDTLTNPEPGFFLLGAKSYGRNTSFLLRNGWTQVEEVFATLPQPAVRTAAIPAGTP
jgi:thioredoxin reductase